MENQRTEVVPPRVLIFPMPAQGHVSSMLTLAELLSLAGIHVTFLNTDHVQNLLLRHTNVQARFAAYPGFLFRTIPDGLPEDHNRSSGRTSEVLLSMIASTKPVLQEMLVSGALLSDASPSVTCIIVDATFSGFATDLAIELDIPIIHFQPASACCVWANFCADKIIEAGEIPIRGNEEKDKLIRSVPGMESFLRYRDLPSFIQVNDLSDPHLNLVSRETRQSCRAQGLIINTFEDLEGPIISHIRTSVCPKSYTIGPLHAQLKQRLAMKNGSKSSKASNSLFEEDRNCMDWLDSQPRSSVIYVSFGSITTFTRDTLTEFWHGLVNSNKLFLWVIRSDLVAEKDGTDCQNVPEELMAATRERGYIVGWVPQEEVLAHQAVGGFLTHNGWNSTLESIVAGVPMICWPYFADQQINSRYVGEVWKLGIDMKDFCDRKVVEKMVNALMVERREEFKRSMAKMARLAIESVCEGGSSYSNLDHLVEYIRLTAKEKKVANQIG